MIGSFLFFVDDEFMEIQRITIFYNISKKNKQSH